MGAGAENNYFNKILLGGTLDRIEIAKFFSDTRHHDKIHAQVANRIVPEASLFLPSASLKHLVRAEITESEAREIIKEK